LGGIVNLQYCKGDHDGPGYQVEVGKVQKSNTEIDMKHNDDENGNFENLAGILKVSGMRYWNIFRRRV